MLKVAGGYRLVAEAGTLNFALLSAREQEAVEEAFGRLLFSLTFDLQFFIQTRPLDLTGEVGRVLSAGASLNGPLQKYTAALAEYLREMMACRSVLVRRCFLVIPWEREGAPDPPGGWASRARAELERRFSLVADALSRCGNLVARRLATEELVELVYNLGNKHRATSARVADAAGRGFLSLCTTGPGRTVESPAALQGGCGLSLSGGVRGLTDLLAPDGFQVCPEEDLIRIGAGRVVRTFFLALVPGRVSVGWLDPLYGFGDVDVSIHLRPGRDAHVINQLSRKITVLESQRILDVKRGDHYNLSRLERAVKDAWQLRDAVQMGTNRVFFVTVLAAVAADGVSALEQKCRLMEETLAGRAVHVRNAFLQQAEAYRSVAPLGTNRLSSIYRNFDLGAGISLFPLARADLAHTGGVFMGTNLYTSAPVFYNNFLFPGLTNFNLNIFGKSGSGKSTTVKLLAARSAVAGVQTVFLDVEGEYGALTAQAGGQSVRLAPNGGQVINIFDLEDEEEEDGRRVLNLVDKVLEVKGLLLAMVEAATGGRESLSAEEMALLEEVVAAEYQSLDIRDLEPASLYEAGGEDGGGGFALSPRKKAMPTVTSLYRRLAGRQDTPRHLLVLLKPFLRGMTLGLFDGQTGIGLRDAPLICFDLSRMEENYLRPVAMHVLLQWLWEKFVKKNPRRKKRVVAEEAWLMLRHPESARFLESMSKRARKRSCSLLVSSQGFKEFCVHPQGKSILTNCSTTVLMKQDATDIDYIYDNYHLSEGEKNFLLSAGVGEALWRIEREATALRVVAAGFERSFIATGEFAASGVGQT
ncbi:MAG: DUF87 domain-containing protein [Peptococcaceae bacterium]|nr:DUF87 domain-containing protein [Peptococcaceae bacterium]